ncbi:MAG: ATP-binding cassette domain-containing protein [Lachnospiraceae bacterium]|nr:ATP-binding cassette domain-containing protein [Lachnospiraceae bacterium]
MIQASNVTLRIGKKALFEDVNIKFTEGNCYGLIGANGAGKSTFLKILSGVLEPTNGEVIITPGQRLSVLEQDHFKYDDYTVLDTVIMGNQHLYDVMKEKDAIYLKEDFNDEDGIRASELEAEFAEMDGWNAESDAATLLNGLGIDTELHYAQMGSLNGAEKVKVLLAKALFGNPDILLLDEPTNNLDLAAIAWLEEFLINFENTVIVVSHDRYFLNKVCTDTADIDYGKIELYAGNYDFWYESSQLLLKQRKEANKKKEEQIKELKEFIARFSANASKSKQATSRKKALEKIELDEIKPSSRKYPYIDFRPNREIGNEVLTVEGISKTIDGEKVLDNISFVVGHDDKIAFVGSNEKAKTALFSILAGEDEPDEGTYKWGVTTSQSYFPKDNTKIFDNDLTIADWLTGYSEIKDATYVRGFLGRMLFAGDDGVKKMRVLSGGEKVRVLLSRMMIEGSNILILDEPTDHLDMEAITALNDGMKKFKGVLLFSSRDHQIVQTTANRIIEILPNGTMIDKVTTYDEYLASDEMAMKRQVYTVASEDEPNGDD